MSVYHGKTKKRQMLEVDKQPWLPQQVQVTLHALMGAAKEGLLALA
ncbi:MAG: IS256 family transposase, partial [Symbiobacterium thermophilum]|nr:IS256 family transposase [Symbiobacterium thermophilum]